MLKTRKGRQQLALMPYGIYIFHVSAFLLLDASTAEYARDFGGMMLVESDAIDCRGPAAPAGAASSAGAEVIGAGAAGCAGGGEGAATAGALAAASAAATRAAARARGPRGRPTRRGAGRAFNRMEPLGGSEGKAAGADWVEPDAATRRLCRSACKSFISTFCLLIISFASLNWR